MGCYAFLQLKGFQQNLLSEQKKMYEQEVNTFSHTKLIEISLKIFRQEKDKQCGSDFSMCQPS